MSELLKFAENELRMAGWFDTDGLYGDMMGHAVMRMISMFADEDHSGMSAPIAMGLFSALANWEPLTPLTGEDAEWCEVSEGVWQNKRCGHVFKGADGHAYDIEGRIFREPSGACYTSHDSRVYVDFPYVPKKEYVDVEPRHD